MKYVWIISIQVNVQLHLLVTKGQLASHIYRVWKWKYNTKHAEEFLFYLLFKISQIVHYNEDERQRT